MKKPQTVMMFVPAGSIVDSAIHDLIPNLDEGDTDYFDILHTKRLPANLIQALHGYFGLHTYSCGGVVFHTECEKE